jgi:uncharacterized membrane protein HdeD (DUF308 family)
MSSVQTTADEQDLMTALARNWWLMLLLGVASIVIGIWAFTQPVEAIEVLSVLFAIWLIITGIVEVIRGFSAGLTGGMRALFIITGVLSLILGFVALRGYWETGTPFVAAWILAIFIGVTFLFRGMLQLFAGIDGKNAPGRGWNIFAGIVYLIAGMCILLVPTSLIALTWVIGIWLVVMGVFEIISSFMMRSAAKKAA